MITDPNNKEKDKGEQPDRGYASDETLNEDEIAGNPTGVGENEEDHYTQWDDEEPDGED
ncbi:hypothetical protein [Pedobacter sp. SYSU D00535]|uniref:hypothetical protein n=1 Tax=Pedobacter sp. SYSU D00535 TaxID=2810308 RepID=UPI001A966C2F|nr:hypothetical protein [Pedobacter sp. SYSU D00535]